MRITKFRLKNHKSFQDSQEIQFSEGINIIVGKNNSGKTALMEAISLSFDQKSHKSFATHPLSSTPLNNITEIEISFTVAGANLKNWFLDKNTDVGIPVPHSEFQSSSNEDYRYVIDQLFNHPMVPVNLKGQLSPGSAINWGYGDGPSIALHEPKLTDNGRKYLQAFARPLPDKSDFQYIGNHYNGIQSDIGFHARDYLTSKIYKFKAERLNIGRAQIGTTKKLEPNASNLPSVLHYISSTMPKAYQKFNDLVKKIFPEIHHVGTRPISHTQVSIFIHTHESERQDLCFELSEWGTGLGQVLAILYVAYFETDEYVLLIDEPNSFLHPGATKTLLGILSTFKQHQYIISSHSAEIFKTPGVSTLKLVSKKDSQSNVKSLSLNEVEQTRECLLELGIEISDVLSSDTCVWVEGPTEQHCFPIIMRKLCGWTEFTTSFIAVKNTGDFEGKRAESTVGIYSKITSGNLILAPKTLFIFDPENRSPQQLQDLEKQNAKFIPRRMYENYLIVPQALSIVLSNLDSVEHTVTDVKSWFDKNNDRFKLAGTPFQMENPDHLKNIDGAKVLKTIFQDLTNSRVSYNKILHGKAITEWLLEHEPSHLKELANFLHATISSPTFPYSA